MPLYFTTYIILFWMPAGFFSVFALKHYPREIRKAYLRTSLLMAGVMVVMEYFYIKFDVWTFSERIDPLLGIWIWKAPIEEFVYWFGATPFCLALYLSYHKLFEKLRK